MGCGCSETAAPILLARILKRRAIGHDDLPSIGRLADICPTRRNDGRRQSFLATARPMTPAVKVAGTGARAARSRQNPVANPSPERAVGLFTKDIKTMDDLFLHVLQDIYYAEKQILKALPSTWLKRRPTVT